MRTFLAATLLLAGCATTQPATRAQMMSAQTRTYEAVTPERAYAAAEQVFRLADEGDMTFSYGATGELRATRKWLMYAVLAAAFGEEKWTVLARPEAAGVVVTVDVVSTATAALFGTPQTGPAASPAVYELFWARMDYLLGRAATWTTCAEHKATGAGSLDPLCLFADDKVPAPPVRAAQ